MNKGVGKWAKWMPMPKKIKRFRKDEDGATAVEFALLASPFFLLLFAIIEVSIYFFAGQVLESGVDNVARLIRTGQLDDSSSKADFENAVCNQISMLFDCNSLHTELRIVAEFDDLNPPAEPTSMSGLVSSWQPPQPSQVAMITVMYEWPIVSNYVASSLSSLSSGNALLTTVAVFKTEPWP